MAILLYFFPFSPIMVQGGFGPKNGKKGKTQRSILIVVSLVMQTVLIQ